MTRGASGNGPAAEESGATWSPIGCGLVVIGWPTGGHETVQAYNNFDLDGGFAGVAPNGRAARTECPQNLLAGFRPRPPVGPAAVCRSRAASCASGNSAGDGDLLASLHGARLGAERRFSAATTRSMSWSSAVLSARVMACASKASSTTVFRLHQTESASAPRLRSATGVAFRSRRAGSTPIRPCLPPG